MMKIILVSLFYSFSIFTFGQINNCDKITVTKDEFTDEITVSTPINSFLGSSSYPMPLVIIKTIKGNSTSYFLHITGAYNNEFHLNRKGAYFIFEDGSKYSDESCNVHFKEHKRGYELSSTIILTQSLLTKFTTNKVKKFRLNLYDGELDDEDASVLIGIEKCIKLLK